MASQKAVNQKAVNQKAVNQKAANQKVVKQKATEQKAIQQKVVAFEARELTGDRVLSTAHYHSELAMKAARKMRRTRQKLKTGQEVCHHLRMMLSSDPVPMRDTAAEQQPQRALGF